MRVTSRASGRTSSRSSGRTSRRSSGRVVVAGLIGLGVFATVWELAVRLLNIRASILIAPTAIVSALIADPWVYLSATWTTAWQMLLGAAIALVLAFVIGAALASSTFLEEATQPVLILILVTPWVAYFNSLVVWLNFGTKPVLFLVAFVTLPGFVFAMASGLRSADPNAVELFRSVDASRTEQLWRLRLPSALPTVFAAARLNTGLALAATYYAEGFNGSQGSLGSIGIRAGAQGGRDALWVTIAMSALLGATLLGTLTVVERRLLHWHASQRTIVS